MLNAGGIRLRKTSGKKNMTSSNLNTFFSCQKQYRSVCMAYLELKLPGRGRCKALRKDYGRVECYAHRSVHYRQLCFQSLHFFLLTMLCGLGPFMHHLSLFHSACSEEISFICASPSQHCFPPLPSQSDIPHINHGKENNGKI